MKNLVADGKVLKYKVTAATVNSGDVLIIGKMVGIAVTDGAAGDTIAVAIDGVFSLPKGSGTLAQGVQAYVNVAEGTGAITIVGTATGNTFAGYVWADAASSDATVDVKLSF
jgi:predicted RecA/RadA family phage recombinase